MYFFTQRLFYHNRNQATGCKELLSDNYLRVTALNSENVEIQKCLHVSIFQTFLQCPIISSNLFVTIERRKKMSSRRIMKIIASVNMILSQSGSACTASVESPSECICVCSFPWFRLIQFLFNLVGLAKSHSLRLPVGELCHQHKEQTATQGKTELVRAAIGTADFTVQWKRIQNFPLLDTQISNFVSFNILDPASK